MKKIISATTERNIDIQRVVGTEIIAYATREKNGIAVLRKIGVNRWGFINLCGSESGITYEGATAYDAMSYACACRDVYVFNNTKEFLAESLKLLK